MGPKRGPNLSKIKQKLTLGQNRVAYDGTNILTFWRNYVVAVTILSQGLLGLPCRR